jgi:hypothetical protein
VARMGGERWWAGGAAGSRAISEGEVAVEAPGEVEVDGRGFMVVLGSRWTSTGVRGS